MTLSTGPWWCAPVFASGWMTTVPAHSFSAPARAVVIAASRCMPGVCAVFGSSSPARTTRTPCRRQSGGCDIAHRLGPAGGTTRIAPVTVDPKSLGGPERVERTLRNMQDNIGYVPGFRRAHGRGVALRGHFTATADAAELTIAEHMQGDRIPVTVRLS